MSEKGTAESSNPAPPPPTTPSESEVQRREVQQQLEAAIAAARHAQNPKSTTATVSASPEPASSSPNVDDEEHPNDNAKYLDELLRDLRQLNNVQASTPGALRQAQAVLSNEIDRVWNIVYATTRGDMKTGTTSGSSRTSNSPPAASSAAVPPPLPSDIYLEDYENYALDRNGWFSYTERVAVPYHPECNFIGRILGPRGISVKQLEADTGCQIIIRGKGSIKDPELEERMRTEPGWEHLNEPLHVLVLAFDQESEEAAMRRVAAGAAAVRRLLVSRNDAHKRRQLVQLAIINGTYKQPAPASTLPPKSPARRGTIG